MSSMGFILFSTTATITTGTAAALTLGANAGRTAEVAQSMGVPEESRRYGPLNVMLALLRRLPFSRSLRRRLTGAGLSWDSAITELVLTAVIILAFLGARPFIGKIAGAVLAAAVPFIAQLPDVSRVLSNGTSAGMSVERALGLASTEVADPAKTELRRVVSQLALGRSLDAALADLTKRMPSRELDVLVRTIVIQSKSGGTLVAALQEIAFALEDRKQLHREVRTVILGSAVSGYVVPFMGIACVIFLNLMKPGVLDDMASSLVGKVILFAALIFFGFGALLIKLVSKVEV